MTSKRVASLFVIYAVLVFLYGLLSTGVIFEAIGRGFLVYVVSGMLPFAVWGARGFRAANAKSLFIPWAILALLLIALMEYGRS
jgi:hypothetical protein